MQRFTFSAAAVLLAASGASHAGPGYVNLGLGFVAQSASADGSVVVGYTPSEYFVWDSGVVTFIGGAPPDSGPGGQPQVTADGQRIAGTAWNPATSAYEMSFYDRQTGAWTNLGGIGGQSDTSISSGWGMSGDGQHIVGLGWANPGTAHAIRWTQGEGVVDMGTTVPGSSSRANAVNDNGSVVVGWQDDQFGFRQGAVWIDGAQTLLTDPTGQFQLSEASAVSANGEWVVGMGNFDNDGQAYRWSLATGTQNLGHLDPSYSGGAVGISDDGSIIVGYDRSFGPPIFGQGFIWTESTGMVNLTDFAASLGINTNGLTLALPLGISGDGSTIFGIASDGSGFIITIPAPASAFALIPGIAIATRRRR